MAEEFQAGIFGDTWWNNINSTRSVFPHMNSPSTCSVAANDAGNYNNNNNTWQTTRPFADDDEETNNNNFVSDHTSSLAFLDVHKPQQNESTAAGSSFLIDSTLQIMGFGCLSSPTWSHSLFGRGESNFDSVVEEESAGIDSCNNSQLIQKDWNTKNFSAASGTSVDTFSTGNCGFPTSYGTNYPSNLIQNLYEPAADPQPQQQNSSSVLFTNPYNNSSSSATATASYENEVVVSPTWSNVVSSNSLMIKPSLMPKKQQLSGLQFSNNTPFWNIASADQALNDNNNNIRAAGSVLAASPQPVQYHHHHHQSTNSEDKKHNSPSSTLNKLKREESPDKKNSCEAVVMKRARIETPSSLPTFKVRKEKLGDRITALQQLVSPFGKTDTASVLHEAIEYIKFLHDQVNVLGSPYMKNGASIQNQQQQQEDCDDNELEDLKSRGLCLVPISSTFPVTHETPVDFWTPTFGGPLFGR